MELDASGYPIPESSGQFWKDNLFSRALRKWQDNRAALMKYANDHQPPTNRPFPGLFGQSGPAPAAGQPPTLGSTPGFAPPSVSAAPPTPATAPTGGAPATPSPSRAAAMGRINQAMVGTPEPEQGPPAPPSSEPLGSIFDDMDPAVIEQILQLGDKDRQLAHAEAMRDQETPQGRYVRNMYIAASPLEHAAAAFGKFRGKRQADRIGQEQIEGRRRILDILKKQ